ncbi:MAG: polysaccharide biosynthesis/export family protein [Elusimicrobiota bacterium]
MIKKLTAAACLASILAGVAEASGEYKVQTGDVLNIRVMRHEDLSGPHAVAPDGTISFPFLGRVAVTGLTLPEVAGRVERGLSGKYVRYPSVTASLEKSSGKKFYIYGEVGAPGQYLLPDEPLTVLRALALAGGLSKGGSESKVKILRAKDGGQAYEDIRVHVGKIISGEEPDRVIQAGDVVTVRQGWF